ncbi:Centrosomal Protein Of 95 Kda [Manis pentadactyla]|nr:Centrosomal Protein Of 95 Kda [Manis pentadactyla]
MGRNPNPSHLHHGLRGHNSGYILGIMHSLTDSMDGFVHTNPVQGARAVRWGGPACKDPWSLFQLCHKSYRMSDGVENSGHQAPLVLPRGSVSVHGTVFRLVEARWKHVQFASHF